MMRHLIAATLMLCSTCAVLEAGGQNFRSRRFRHARNRNPLILNYGAGPALNAQTPPLSTSGSATYALIPSGSTMLLRQYTPPADGQGGLIIPQLLPDVTPDFGNRSSGLTAPPRALRLPPTRGNSGKVHDDQDHSAVPTPPAPHLRPGTNRGAKFFPAAPADSFPSSRRTEVWPAAGSVDETR